MQWSASSLNTPLASLFLVLSDNFNKHMDVKAPCSNSSMSVGNNIINNYSPTQTYFRPPAGTIKVESQESVRYRNSTVRENLLVEGLDISSDRNDVADQRSMRSVKCGLFHG